MFETHLHVKAIDILQEICGDSSEWVYNLVYELAEEYDIEWDSNHAVKIWSDRNNHVYDADDNSLTAQIGRWIAIHIDVDYIYVDF